MDPQDLEVARDAVQAVLDKYVPGFLKSQVPKEAALELARAALQAVQDKKEGKIL